MPVQTARRQTRPYSEDPRLHARPSAARAPRVEALDLARGIAVALMILSHGVKGLLAFESFPYWGLVPVHLVTKFSSSLFIIVFGIALALIYVPHVGAEGWPEKRRKLMVRGLKVLFWYKLLTVVELFHLHPRQEIIDTLLYKSFPSYVEILGFYGLALLWIPWALSLWKKTPFWLRIFVPAAFWWGTEWLRVHNSVFQTPQIQAIFIEHDDFYTWGQFSRAPLVFLGLLLGESLPHFARARIKISTVLMSVGALLFTGFVFKTAPAIGEGLRAVALNQGKHPPEMAFMLFSLGGAFTILGACLRGGNLWARRLGVITNLGKDAMGAFVFHVGVLFIVYRFLMDYWLKVPYEKALLLSVLLIFMTSAWIKVKRWAV